MLVKGIDHCYVRAAIQSIEPALRSRQKLTGVSSNNANLSLDICEK